MLAFFFIFWTGLFLAVGALAFVVCATAPVLRRFALSIALWFALWSPGVIAWMLFAGMVTFAADFGATHMPHAGLHLPPWPAGIGIGLFCLASISIAVIATLLAWLHQIAIHRMTFPLFRVYASLVSAGIGSVWGWALGFWIAVEQLRFGLALWLPAMATLIAAFGYLAFRHARTLRGTAPQAFTWLSKEEFEGIPTR